MSDLYDADFLIWSERQAELLRRMASGERVNELDWENLIEEVEGLGRSELNAVRSLLARALEHRLKAVAWPESVSVAGWLDEASVFLDDAAGRWTPSMAQRIELEAMYLKAAQRVRRLRYREGSPNALPELCPVTLQELIDNDADLLDRRFRAGEQGP